jgi:hypothetical protein
LQIKTLMGAMRALESHVNIDLATIFSNGLLDQMLLVEATGSTPTVGTHYIHFYLQLLFVQLPTGAHVFSPSRKAFVTRGWCRNFFISCEN